MASVSQVVQRSLDATKVEYIQLGKSGLRVSSPILGAMSLGSTKWAPWVIEGDEAMDVLKAAYDSGITSWDTANMYSNGMSETLIGQAIKKHKIPREKLVLMTKCCLPCVEEDPGVSFMANYKALTTSRDFINQSGLSRSAIFSAVNASLKRLDTDYIDLLQIHRFDATVPIEETMKALHDLVESGKVRYIGASSMWTWQFAQMQFVARTHGWTEFVSMQNQYSLCYREEEREMNKFCAASGVGIIPWSPLFGGKLARPIATKTVRGSAPGPMSRDLTPADQDIIGRVEKLASEKGWSMSQVALVWVRQKGCIPITGLSKLERVDEAAAITGKSLTADEIKFLEEPYIPKNIMGHQ